jgi:hypothetical protein
VFVERKGNVGLERQARAFEDDFWGKLAHGGIILKAVPSTCFPAYFVDFSA